MEFVTAPTDSCVLDDVVIGELVKVCYKCENFWVKVTEIDGDNIKGTVDNKLSGDYGFNLKDKVSFNKTNIFEVYDETNAILKMYMLYGPAAMTMLPQDKAMKLRSILMKRKLK